MEGCMPCGLVARGAVVAAPCAPEGAHACSARDKCPCKRWGGGARDPAYAKGERIIKMCVAFAAGFTAQSSRRPCKNPCKSP